MIKLQTVQIVHQQMWQILCQQMWQILCQQMSQVLAHYNTIQIQYRLIDYKIECHILHTFL